MKTVAIQFDDDFTWYAPEWIARNLAAYLQEVIWVADAFVGNAASELPVVREMWVIGKSGLSEKLSAVTDGSTSVVDLTAARHDELGELRRAMELVRDRLKPIADWDNPEDGKAFHRAFDELSKLLSGERA